MISPVDKQLRAFSMKLQRLPPGLARSQASKAIQRLAGASQRGCFEGMGVLVTGLESSGSDNETANPTGAGQQAAYKVFLKLRPQIIGRQHLTLRFIAVRCESGESECEVARHTQGGRPPSPVTKALYAPASPRNNPARN